MKASLSIAFENLRGKAGTLVVQKSRSGLVVRPNKQQRNPRTGAQQAVRGNFGKAAAALKNLTTAQLTQWQAYAQTIVKTNKVTGDTYHPTAGTAFVGLAAKFLQVNPAGTIPTTPPAGPFTGDSITVTATAGSGKVTFTASAINAPGITTELLLQQLPSKNRTPQARNYRTKGFNNWNGGLTQLYVLAPGYYAAAYRFVNTATGQESPLIPLSTQQVTMAIEEGGKKAA